MEGVFAILAPFAPIAFVFWVLLQSVLRWREISRETQIMAQLVAQVRSGEEAAVFLESPSARALFDRMVDRRTLVLQRVLRALQSGIVLVVLGIAIFVIRTQFTGEQALAALVFGTLSSAMGIAFLLAGGMSYALSLRWGLLKETIS
jgi:hypothetical protein